MPSIYANQWRIRALKLKPEVFRSINLNNVYYCLLFRQKCHIVLLLCFYVSLLIIHERMKNVFHLTLHALYQLLRAQA